MTNLDESALIHDWNAPYADIKTKIQFDDETLRDGLQSPSAIEPSLEDKVKLVHLMNKLGIHTANVGLPGASKHARDHIAALCKEMEHLAITPNVACRTMVHDIQPVADLVQELGSPVEVCAFIGSSGIRMFAEGWDFAKVLRLAKEGVEFAHQEGLPVMFVTEDTARAKPEEVDALYRTAIEAGAGRVCICDTCGHITPAGTRRLVTFVKDIITDMGVDVGIDWHGHRDRGLGLANSMAAIEAGATRIHGTALGIGERAGNTEMDLLLANLKLNGWIDNDMSQLGEYVKLASETIGTPIPHTYPIFGSDAFETGTGVHAAAVVKAFKKGDHWLADRVYSGVPAGMFGLEQSIKVGPMSGKSNVAWVLENNGVQASDERIANVLEAAKNSPRLLSDKEVLAAAHG
jgi:isopropylmalate/homocitrate/citramalate synthase